jgi:hypothetical protein
MDARTLDRRNAAHGLPGRRDPAKDWLIKYVHGRITILDRKRLEAGSCECNATVKGHFDRLGL